MPASGPRARPRTMALFFDPKPRQLHSAASTCAGRLAFGMKSRSQAGSGSRWLIVGGSTPRCSASAAVTRPPAPLAPCGWPIIDLVDDPGSRSAWLPKTRFTQRHFDGVVQLRRGAVVVDVADALGRPLGAIDRRAHGADDLAAVGIHLDAVIGVARRGVALDRGVDGRAARPRRLLALEHQHPRALAEHEAVAAAVEGPRGGRRACRCSASTSPASARSRRSCPASRRRRRRPRAARRTRRRAAATARSRSRRSSSCSRSRARG